MCLITSSYSHVLFLAEGSLSFRTAGFSGVFWRGRGGVLLGGGGGGGGVVGGGGGDQHYIT